MTAEKPFRVVVADPPWKFSDRLPGGGRGAVKHYDCLSTRDIIRFPLPPIADDALLFLWRVASMQVEALDVMRIWGFAPKSEIVWIKTREKSGVVQPFGPKGKGLALGMGRYVRGSHETCLIGRRGKGKVRDRSVRSIFFAPRGGHSEKPELFFEIVEQLSGGPYVELFARRQRKGWQCLGLEAGGAG
jgi:N6-adenosine-specific RNA methylase IME4